MNVGGFAKFCHIGQKEDIFLVLFQLSCDYLELLGCVQSLREDHIGTSIDIGFGSIDALVKAKNSLGVGPCADDELSI